MNRIDLKFKELKKENKKALIAYLTCGYPDLKTTEKLVLELEARGADIIELGVPFSDPLADGPVIQESSSCALKKGINLKQIFSLVRSLRKSTQMPICLMGYYNPVFSFGPVKFIREALRSEVDGIIIPDLPPEEDRELVSLSKKLGLKTIFFLSPTSSRERIKYISRVSSGFIYYVSLTGVTGARQSLPLDLRENIRIIKSHTGKPVCVGFGISRPEHVSEVFKIADGAIVGSALIQLIKNNSNRPDLIESAGMFIQRLRCTKNQN